jgi:DNA invertase Pin-like site-specific DNA recombinase
VRLRNDGRGAARRAIRLQLRRASLMSSPRVLTPIAPTRIDRLARSIGDLQAIVRTVRARGAVLKATEQPIDTGTAALKCFLDMLGVFAEFETNLRRERQLEGIAEAKRQGLAARLQ